MDKKNEGRFTIQFSATNPQHLQVIEILNRQGRRSKAPYLVSAVLHYESCSETPSHKHIPPLDEKTIEAIVRRVLKKEPDATPAKEDVYDAIPDTAKRPVRHSEDIDLDEAIEAFGEENLQIIMGAVDAFREQ